MVTLKEVSRPRRMVNLLLLVLIAGGGIAWSICEYAPSRLTDSEALSIYIELRLAQLELGEESAAAISARNQIFKQRNSSIHQFEKWMRAYRQRADEWDLLQSEMIDQVDSLRRESSRITNLAPQQIPSAHPKGLP